jgi:hypothetical protein
MGWVTIVQWSTKVSEDLQVLTFPTGRIFYVQSLSTQPMALSLEMLPVATIKFYILSDLKHKC